MAHSVFFESKIAAYLTSEGVSYKTQSELAAQQTADVGYPTCTPDFLLTSPLTLRLERDDIIVRHDVHWIEVKAYRLPESGPLVDSLMAQVKKYVGKFGSGAVIFQDGFVANMHVPGVLLLAWDDKQ